MLKALTMSKDTINVTLFLFDASIKRDCVNCASPCTEAVPPLIEPWHCPIQLRDGPL
ncbi:hypothetical protein K0M31_016704 [Melipona bicolor]|uniref:Uncharacterized protein n=1 Tax=Melipona bicolor TaxID=60889 RepID=A0AA40FE30_9HYME|nr:hypothetical protein K0M31_016704 [Melipona bicolor]